MLMDSRYFTDRSKDHAKADIESIYSDAKQTKKNISLKV